MQATAVNRYRPVFQMHVRFGVGSYITLSPYWHGNNFERGQMGILG